MAKTLVLKNTNFGTNAVATVVFSGVPCEGISFSSDTVVITGYTPTTISYTLSPEDTTDSVTWESSNTDIVTVSDGVLTVIGVGECTVTATCGNFYATASVSVSISYIFDFFEGTSGTVTDGTCTISNASGRVITTGSGAQKADYPFANQSGVSELHYPVLMPKNTASVRISVTSTTYFYNSDATVVKWMKNEDNQGATLQGYIKYLSTETGYNIKSNATKTFAVPEGADVILFQTRLNTSVTTGLTPDQVMTNAGFSMEFLPPVTE